MYVKTHCAVFAVAWIRIWKVQTMLFSQFHVRKEYDLHHPKLPPASLDGAAMNYYDICVFIPKYFSFLSIFYYY
jgi:hypothetical protein